METRAPRQTLRQKTSQVLRQKQIGRMKLGQLFSLPEPEFRKLIKQIENACRLTSEETEIFKDFLNRFESEKLTSGDSVSTCTGSISSPAAKTFKIASIER